MIGAVRVGPEFQHPARGVKGAGHRPHLLKFAHIPQINQDGGVKTLQLRSFMNTDLVDQQPCGGNQFGDRLDNGHGGSAMVSRTITD